MGDIKRGLLINYKDIFGKSNDSYSVNLSSLDKITWFKILARFNFLLRNGKKTSVIDVLSLWFRAENDGYANELLNKIQQAYQEEIIKGASLTTLNVWTNLTLLDDILKHNDINNPIDAAETERKLFDVYMAVNEIYGEKSARITKEIYKEGDGASCLLDWFAKVTLTILMPYNDIANPNVIELWITQFIKACFCFEYFEREHSSLLNRFLEKYGIKDWRDYLKGIMPVIDHAVFHNKEGINSLSIKHSKDKEKARLFLDSLSLSSDVIYEVKTDFIHARSNPVFKVDNDTYLVVDQVLLINKMYNSVFFEMLKIIKDDKISIKPYKNFFQLYTTEFIEHFIAYKLLGHIYGGKQLFQISGRDIVEQLKIDTEPDYYVRDANKVFLYEIKGSIITGDAKQSFKFKDIQEELIKKYYVEDDKNPKAIKQLVKRINILFSGGAKYDTAFDAQNAEIFPILLVSEMALITPGINHLLNKWFVEELMKEKSLKSKFNQIHKLIIIDMNSLILYSDQFKNDPGLMEKMIRGYTRQTALNRISPRLASINSQKLLEDTIMNMLVPFTYYLRSNLKAQTPSLFTVFGNGVFGEEV